MDQPILQIIKKLLGIDSSITVFDIDLITHINAVLMILEQLGVKLSHYILQSTEDCWADFTDDERLASWLNTYIYLKVRLIFDPPSTSFVIDAIQKQIAELEWRLNVECEEVIE